MEAAKLLLPDEGGLENPAAGKPMLGHLFAGKGKIPETFATPAARLSFLPASREIEVLCARSEHKLGFPLPCTVRIVLSHF